MELSRKPSNNQESQQTKRLGSLNVRGCTGHVGQVNKSKEEGGTQFERKEESYERRAEELGESGGMAGAESFGGDLKSFGGDHKTFGGDHKSFGGDHKSFGRDHKNFGGDQKAFGGDHKEVTSDMLPGVSTVSLSFVSQKKTKPNCTILFVSSDRSSYSDNGLLYIRGNFFRFSLSPLMQLMLQVSL